MNNATGAPSAIVLHTRSRQLELVWPHLRVRLDAAYLRAQCRCAGCRSQPRMQNVIGSDVDLERIEYFGVAGLQLFFSDGHARGIFPWSYLRQLGAAAALA